MSSAESKRSRGKKKEPKVANEKPLQIVNSIEGFMEERNMECFHRVIGDPKMRLV